MFVKFASAEGKAVLLPPSPPPSIIDDGDGMAHIASNLAVNTECLDIGLKHLIDAVLHR